MPAHRDTLHELIRSLSPSEKRYFKLQTKTDGTKSYLKLFDAMEALVEYDELALRKALAGEKLLNQLHVAKNYLYKQILRALRSFQAGSNTNASPFLAFAEHLGDMNVLHAKGLFHQSRKALGKAEAIAEEYDDDLLRLIIATYRHDRVSELVDAKSQAVERFRGRVQLLERLRLGYSLKRSLEVLYDEIALKGSSDVSEDPLRAINYDELSFSSKIDYCSYRCYDHFSKDEFSGAAEWSKRAIELFDSQPHQRERSTEIYLSLLSNYLTCLLSYGYSSSPELRTASGFDEVLRSFDNVNARTAVQRTRVWATRRLAEFEWALATWNERRLKELLELFPKEFTAKRAALSKLETGWFYFNLSKAYFWTRQHSKALDWINKLLDDPEFKKFEEYYGNALIYSLVIHFELGNAAYLKTAIGATKRYLASRGLTSPFEQNLLEHLTQGKRPKITVTPVPQYFEFDRWFNQHKEVATL